MSSVPVAVALVDDDTIVRSALTTYLDAAGGFDVIHECTNGLEALEALAARPVDVVIMDVRMPQMDGITATTELRRLYPGLKILVLTSFDADEAVREALAAGANGFLLKDTTPQGLVDAIRTILQGSSVVSPGPITRLLRPNTRPNTRPKPRPDAVHPPLSPRELEILRLLCQALSNTEIAERLSLSESTVKSHVSALLTKLGVTSRLKAVVRAHELGLATKE